MSGSNRISRRDFIKATTGVVGGIIGAVFGIPAIGYLIAPALREDKAGAPVPIGVLEDIPVGKFHPFSFTITKINGWERSSQSYGVYVLREEGIEVIVFSDVCTHLSCRVNWDPEQEGYFCPCHAALFDKHGNVLSGPPPRPLDRFETKMDGGQLFIHLMEG